jgi:hypothetical protein
MSPKHATLEYVDVDDLLHKGVLPSQTSTSANTTSLHKPVHQLLEREPCFGEFELDHNSEMCQTSQMEGMRDHCLQDGKQEDVC